MIADASVADLIIEQELAIRKVTPVEQRPA
jgi:hypothetical protein